MIRYLKDVDLEPYAGAIIEYEKTAILPVGPLDKLRAAVFPQLAARTGQTLEFIIREIYRELAIRSGYFSGFSVDDNGKVIVKNEEGKVIGMQG